MSTREPILAVCGVVDQNPGKKTEANTTDFERYMIVADPNLQFLLPYDILFRPVGIVLPATKVSGHPVKVLSVLPSL